MNISLKKNLKKIWRLEIIALSLHKITNIMNIVTTYKTTIYWSESKESAVTVQVDGQDEAIFSLETEHEYSPDMVEYTKAHDYDVQIMSGDIEELLEVICKNPAKWVS